MTIDDMKRGGEILSQVSWTDEELEIALKATTWTIAYVESRRELFGACILSALRQDREKLEGFRRQRGQ